jgi:hypothetical protein
VDSGRPEDRRGLHLICAAAGVHDFIMLLTDRDVVGLIDRMLIWGSYFQIQCSRANADE